MAVSYKELGLVNTKEMFAKAVKGGYAIPAFNFPGFQLQHHGTDAGHRAGRR